MPSAALLAAAVIAIGNNVRVAHHLRPLRTDHRLAVSAQVLRCPNGPCTNHDGGILKRIRAAGFQTWYAAENLAWGVNTPHEAIDVWLGSPHHRAILLDRHVTRTGVAVEKDAAGGLIYAQDFAK